MTRSKPGTYNDQADNVVTVKRIRKRKLTRGRYRATITSTAGGLRLEPIRIAFKMRR